MNLIIKDLKTYKNSMVFFEQNPSKSISVFIISILVLFILFITWSVFFSLEDVVKAQAVLRPIERVSTIKSLFSGMIVTKNFRNGQSVNQGDILFEYDCINEKKELIMINVQLEKNHEELQKQNELLKYIQDDSVEYFNYTDNILLDIYESEKDSYLLKIQMLTNKVVNEKDMPLFLFSKKNLENAENELKQSQIAYDSWLNSKIFSTKDCISNLEKKYESLIQQKNSKEKIISSSIIISPINGYVEEVKELNVFDNVLAGEEILKIIPYNEEKLKAEIAVNATFVPRLKINQKVYLRFTGLPTNEFGKLETSIKMIPADMIVQNNVPLFIIEVDLDKPYLVSKKGEVMKLRPGIIADARIVTHKDTVLKMILKKLDFIS